MNPSLRMTVFPSTSVLTTSSSTTRCRTRPWVTSTTPGPWLWGPWSPSLSRSGLACSCVSLTVCNQEEISAMITDIVEKLHWNPAEIARQLKVCFNKQQAECLNDAVFARSRVTTASTGCPENIPPFWGHPVTFSMFYVLICRLIWTRGWGVSGTSSWGRSLALRSPTRFD